MIKGVASFESKVKDRSSIWYVDNDCPIEIAKEMLFQFQKMVGQVEDQQKAALEQAAKEAEEKKASESKVEPIAEAQNVQS